MAKPRIFVSSTYYDLKHFRADIERFINEQGFESVLNEKGHIPYGSAEKLEEYCYKEIDFCDILISIIGGRFGSESREKDYSVSNMELKTAIDKGKQVYIFIDSAVFHEHSTYKVNKTIDSMQYTAVDDRRVYQFIDEIYSLPINNQIKSFDSVHDITTYLKEQWAGLFQRLLSESARQKEINLIEDLKNTSKTLNNLVAYLIDEKSKDKHVINDILFSNHPAFDEVRRKIEIPYRIIFQDKDELNQLLNARQFDELDELVDFESKKGFFTWKRRKSDLLFRISKEVFEDDFKLKIFTPNEWHQDWVQTEEIDDIPF